MSDPKKHPAPQPAQTARQDGAQGRSGPNDTAPDGAVDTSDPVLAEKIAEVADEVHANA